MTKLINIFTWYRSGVKYLIYQVLYHRQIEYNLLVISFLLLINFNWKTITICICFIEKIKGIISI